MTKKVKLPENAFKSETETKVETCRNILNYRSLEFEKIAQEIVHSFGEAHLKYSFIFQNLFYKIQRARILVSVILMMTVKRKLLLMIKMLMWFALTEDVRVLPGSAWKMLTVR